MKTSVVFTIPEGADASRVMAVAPFGTSLHDREGRVYMKGVSEWVQLAGPPESEYVPALLILAAPIAATLAALAAIRRMEMK